eukprot:GHVL01010369.1.p2 GENE.GHVL01010369.1~~GHVL01010369.1.p2  ORF type:complete len:265 (-),score=33.88 GHVL01010369.1:2436-3230(-)
MSTAAYQDDVTHCKLFGLLRDEQEARALVDFLTLLSDWTCPFDCFEYIMTAPLPQDVANDMNLNVGRRSGASGSRGDDLRLRTYVSPKDACSKIYRQQTKGQIAGAGAVSVCYRESLFPAPLCMEGTVGRTIQRTLEICKEYAVQQLHRRKGYMFHSIHCCYLDPRDSPAAAKSSHGLRSKNDDNAKLASRTGRCVPVWIDVFKVIGSKPYEAKFKGSWVVELRCELSTDTGGGEYEVGQALRRFAEVLESKKLVKLQKVTQPI